MNEPALNREIVGGDNPDRHAVFAYRVGMVSNYPVMAERHSLGFPCLLFLCGAVIHMVSAWTQGVQGGASISAVRANRS